MCVQELAMMMYLARKVGVILLRRLEHDFGAIGELMCGQINFAEASFAYQFTKRVVDNGLEVDRGELVQEGLVGVCELEVRTSVYHAPYGQRMGRDFIAPYCAVPVLHTRPASWPVALRAVYLPPRPLDPHA